MLVLTRKPGERIQIGREVEISVLSIEGQRVRIGIKAPDEVPIRRGELVFETELNSPCSQELVVAR